MHRCTALPLDAVCCRHCTGPACCSRVLQVAVLEHGRYRRLDGSHAPQRVEAYVASAEDVRSRWSHHR
eukprot:7117268-Prymnesium_polylepis.1